MKKGRLLIVFIILVFVSCDKFNETTYNESTDTEEKPDNEDSVEEADTNNDGDHDEASDYTWNSDEVNTITLNGTSITENSDAVVTNGSKLTINDQGVFSISGTLTDGQIIVDAEETDLVKIILNGVDIKSSNSAPIYIKKALKVIIAVNSATTNTLEDGTVYIYDDEEDEEPNATIFSKTDLTIFGDGELNITANFNDGINCKDGLITACNAININSVDDGVRGKDYLIIKEGTYNIVAEDDGLKSDNDSDEGKGYINIISGNINIEAGGDGISAETDLLIDDGTFTITTNGYVTSTNGVSSKALKSGINTIIEGGKFNITTTEDGIHSDETITINSGTFTIGASDDGIHADYDLTINDGDINITKSYEGIESADGNIYINGGVIQLVSSDDGLNVAGGGDSMGGPGHFPSSSSSSNCYIYITGGKIAINAQGDGIDANGSVKITGGITIVNGPTGNGNGALDYDNTFIQDGGTLIAVGSSGMLQAPASSSAQNSVALVFRSSQTAGTLLHLENEAGDNLFTFKPAKQFQAVVFSSPDLEKGSDYKFYSGGDVVGESFNGLYTNEEYTPGTLQSDFTQTYVVTGIQLN